MKIIIALFLISTAASAACEKKDHMKAAGDHVRKEAPKGSLIGIKPSPAQASEYFFNVDLEDSAGMHHESGKLRVTDVKGKCHVQVLQHQKSSQGVN